MADSVQFVSFVLLCAVVALTDLIVRKVKNTVVVVALVAQGGFVFFAVDGTGYLMTRLEPAVTGLVVGFVLLLPLYAFRAMGAGDVKFFAVVGWWLGPSALLPVFVIASLLAGVHALALTASGTIWAVAIRDVGERVAASIPVPASWRGATDETRRRQRRGIPYAAYMAVGAVGMLVWRI